MGSHTRLYRPLDRTFETARELAIRSLKRKIARTEEFITIGLDDNRDKSSGRRKCPEQHIPDFRKLNQIRTRWLRRIESNLPVFKAAVWKFQPDNSDLTYVRERRTWYTNCGQDAIPRFNPFRTGDYDLTLWSFEETLEYLNQKKIESPQLFEDFPVNWEMLEEFWLLYPKGMIEIG
jgi:hypothetical protein